MKRREINCEEEDEKEREKPFVIFKDKPKIYENIIEFLILLQDHEYLGVWLYL